MSKLETLAKVEGFEDVMELLHAASLDSVVPGICRMKGCDYTCGVEPDSVTGWCEECEHNSVASCLRLAGII